MLEKELKEHFEQVKEEFGQIKHRAIPMFDDALAYPLKDMIELNKLSNIIDWEFNSEKRKSYIEQFVKKMDMIRPLEQSPEKIYLWKDGNMPQMTNYTDNHAFRYNHDPDFKPYMYELLLPWGISPKGAVVVIPGGDHGESTMTEGIQVCLELNHLGYQCFLLHNRPNHNPWCGQECGADVARALRWIRSRAEQYHIQQNQIALAGFSNGGLTGEACIQYYSGHQKVKDHFPDYIPDELDEYSGNIDAFLCIYGPRLKGTSFDYTHVIYPPVFFAIGRKDAAMENFNAVYPDLIEHGVTVEAHTFAGVPHGVGGRNLIDGEVKYPNFQLWLPLADVFMQEVYRQR